MIFEIIQGLLLLGIVSSTYIALKHKDLLISVIFIAIMSMLLSLEFYILRAPDVAIAEAAIGAGLSTAIYLVAINKTKRWEDERSD
jgi:uncharacterized MnhB-related membrane protein